MVAWIDGDDLEPPFVAEPNSLIFIRCVRSFSKFYFVLNQICLAFIQISFGEIQLLLRMSKRLLFCSESPFANIQIVLRSMSITSLPKRQKWKQSRRFIFVEASLLFSPKIFLGFQFESHAPTKKSSALGSGFDLMWDCNHKHSFFIMAIWRPKVIEKHLAAWHCRLLGPTECFALRTEIVATSFGGQRWRSGQLIDFEQVE